MDEERVGRFLQGKAGPGVGSTVETADGHPARVPHPPPPLPRPKLPSGAAGFKKEESRGEGVLKGKKGKLFNTKQVSGALNSAAFF